MLEFKNETARRSHISDVPFAVPGAHWHLCRSTETFFSSPELLAFRCHHGLRSGMFMRVCQTFTSHILLEMSPAPGALSREFQVAAPRSPPSIYANFIVCLPLTQSPAYPSILLPDT
jgi:hypothetical protein